ncbi:hypothetical protein GCM10010218_48890 [Streptomyces mashuensis]|uniref:Uncharacterized protein n=1 Tax=Streptomyces mashuensis TaxID=33904 RepID=A0A919B782_9ACTN|nr:hypothetical protein GCM10010218_48890 [Streptomyces mashuensis]
MHLTCEFDPSHRASVHIVTARPDGRGLKIDAHVCADDVNPWVSMLHGQDGHQFISQHPINDRCRPYGLCATR